MNTHALPVLVAVLVALLDLGHEGRPAHAVVLARRTCLPFAVVAGALVHLERRGLVDAARCRLTLRGLAVAAGLAAQAQPVAQVA